MIIMPTDELKKHYGPGDSLVKAVDGLNISVEQTLVMITHNDNLARMADRIVRIEDGKLYGQED